MAHFQLYAYQEEVVERALQGENTIIWLPTGGGKTRAAVYVASRHLETTPNAKVVLLVNTVHLVSQHYTKEFKPHLSDKYSVQPVSGNSDEKDFFGLVMQDKDVVICTAELLWNALMDTDEAKHIELSDITLLILDECHHTQKKTVYNKIMRCYVEKKLKGEGPLPQILGLTASPGAGGAKTLDRAVEHVLQICANLDSAIVSTQNYVSELKQKVPRPVKEFNIVEKRPEDPFGDHLKWLMNEIHEYMNLGPDVVLRTVGTQEYEADVVTLKKKGIKDNDRVVAQCAVHLRKYNDALLTNDTLRMVDAYQSLVEFYDSKSNTEIDATDVYLVGLFKANRLKLRELSQNPQYENPKMAMLERTLLEQFGSGVQSRGIIFSRTRFSTLCLKEWVYQSGALQRASINADNLNGAGTGATHMTQHEQEDTIQRFRKGSLNLLIATSVAEEGLDIPECNLVVRYGLLTNEIAQQQASGRARARDSIYSVVADEGGREVRREHLNEYLEGLAGDAIAKVQNMSPREFRKKIAELQERDLASCQMELERRKKKNGRFSASRVQLLCENCFTPVARGSDIKLIENSNFVNISQDFKEHYKFGPKVILQKTFEDWEPGCKIKCSNCNTDWGYEVKYKEKVLLPNLAIKNFALDTPDGRMTVKKWKDVPFTVENFNFVEYCEENFPNLYD